MTILSDFEVLIGFVILVISLFLLASNSDNVKIALKATFIAFIIALLIFWSIKYIIWLQVPPLTIPIMMLAIILGKLREERNSAD